MPWSNQTSFAGGVLSPSLQAHVDLQKYSIGLAKGLNIFIEASGGASNRAGTQLVAPMRDETRQNIFWPFEAAADASYVLEVGHLYIRIYTNGSIITKTPKAITDISNSNPALVTSVAHGLTTGKRVYLAGVVGMAGINGREFSVVVTTPDTFQLQGFSSVDIGDYGGGGFFSEVVEVVTPYNIADIRRIKHIQSNDVMTLTHNNYAPMELRRLANDNWVLVAINTASTVTAPTGCTVTATQGYTPSGQGFAQVSYTYAVSAIMPNGDESPVSNDDTDDNQLGYNSNYNTITWNAVAGADRYAVFRKKNGIYGFIGQTPDLTFKDDNIAPNFGDGPNTFRNPWPTSDHYPATAFFYQQRRGFSNKKADPQHTITSKSGFYTNFGVSVPLKDSDAVEFSIASRQIQKINHVLALEDLLIFTETTEWKASGVGSEPLTPSSIVLRPQSNYGSDKDVVPIVIGSQIVFLQAKGNVIRDIGYKFESNKYEGNDLTVLARHFFKGKRVVDWAFAQVPHNLLWLVMNDGSFLTLTYIREHEIWAWSQHDTFRGKVETVTVVSEGQEDAVYFGVRRKIGTKYRRFIERLHTRQFIDVKDCFFVDCGLSYDVPLTITAVTRGASTILTVPNHGMVGGDFVTISDCPIYLEETDDNENVTRLDINSRYQVGFIDGNKIELLNFHDGTDIDTTGWIDDVGEDYGAARKMVRVLSGLDHLEGEQVSILADGNVILDKVVDGGQVDIDDRAGRVHVGLKIVSDLETLTLDMQQTPVGGIMKNISDFALKVENTRGLEMGTGFRTKDLFEQPERQFENYDQPVSMTTGAYSGVVGCDWSLDGHMCIRQDKPLPMTILAVLYNTTYAEMPSEQ